MDMFQFGFEDLDNLVDNEVFDDEFNEDDYIIEKTICTTWGHLYIRQTPSNVW